MVNRIGIAAILALFALPACRSQRAGWDGEAAASARKIEVQVDRNGQRHEVEYHIAPEQVPAVVRAAMDRLHPGSPFDNAERESHGGHLYYELSRKVQGMAVEAMFTPDGKLHQEEIQVARSAVPPAVRDRAMSSVPGARADKWEEIRDAKRELVGYHVKLSRDADKYKVILSADGKLKGVYREVPAEIEVPVD